MDRQTPAAKSFYRAIRDFAEDRQRHPWKAAIYYTTLPDEMHDPTLVSRRVYGRPDEFLAVMAAAGLNLSIQPMPQATRLALPNEQDLVAIKRRTGFESRAAYRDGDVPVWAG